MYKILTWYLDRFGKNGTKIKNLKREKDIRHYSQREKCPYSEFFWSVFSRNQAEYEEIQSISTYSVRMRENTN